MKELLSRESLNIKEIDLFRFLIKWGKKNYSSNEFKNKIESFLEYIKFPLMSFKELIREVRPLNIISDLKYIEALEFNGDKEYFNQIKKIEFKLRKGIEKKKILPDFFIEGPNYSLSNNNKKIKKIGSNKWNCAAITNSVIKGFHKWSLKINNITDGQIMIGISPNDINQNEIYNYSKCGWYFYCYNSTLRSGPPFNFNGKSYSNTGLLKNGDIIDIELNMEKQTIKYFINGNDYDIAYDGILIDKPLNLSIILHYVNDGIELISYSSS